MLARAGWDVALIEQHRFPRDKVCGECLSAMGMRVAARLGLDKSIKIFGAIELTRTILVAPDARFIELALPQPMWGVSRAGMDNLLLQGARNAGATILQPARCER